MALGKKTGGRVKGSKNKLPGASRKARRALGREAHETLAQLDRQRGKRSMGQILIEGARYLDGLATKARKDAAQNLGDQSTAVELTQAAAKLAKDAGPYLYPTLQSIKHSGDEDAPPIRIESMSDYQLEQLLKRLSRT